jgi:D-glycero-D-manno-heptose 1,7-bisphosphate phosphatase
MNQPAIFFDRDGVLIEDHGYVYEIVKKKWIDGAREAVKAANEAGYLVFVVTNQSGVARGYFKEQDVEAFHASMAADLATIGARIDAFEYCPYHPDGVIERYRQVSPRRKPAPGMITDLLERFAIDISRSVLIGDKLSDLEAAQIAGVQGILFSGGNLAQLVKSVLYARNSIGN